MAGHADEAGTELRRRSLRWDPIRFGRDRANVDEPWSWPPAERATSGAEGTARVTTTPAA